MLLSVRAFVVHFSCSSASFFRAFLAQFRAPQQAFFRAFRGLPRVFFFFVFLVLLSVVTVTGSRPEPIDAYCICTAIYAFFQFFWELRTGSTFPLPDLGIKARTYSFLVVVS